MGKEIIEYKDSFISKIKKFIKNLFGIKDNVKEDINEQKEISNMEKNDFKESIEIKQDDEELRIKRLQKEYKAGNIKEEDMTSEEHEKLIDLYKRQNEELREKINTKKQKIRKRITDLK